ncbi:MAG: hypothetical protein ACOH5I_01635 [Oligoflexus sp.]
MEHIDTFVQTFRNIRIKVTNSNELLVEDVRFEPALHSGEEALEEIVRAPLNKTARGFLFEKLSTETRVWLEKNKISYMTKSGFGAIFLADQSILLRPRGRLNTEKTHLTPFPTTKPIAKPSRMITPHGLTILDTIARLPTRKLSGMSGLAFAKSYGVAQPSLSKLLSSVGAQNLLDLRKSIGELGKNWWLNAMQEPRTGRGMTPFLRQAQNYRLHNRDLNRKELGDWAEEVRSEYKNKIFPGPVEVVKAIGAVADKTVSFWADPLALSSVKRKFKLVPVRIGEEVHCSIAVPKTDFHKESILSLEKDFDVPGLPSDVLTLNLFRVIWDLTHMDSRARESRTAIMEILLNAV